MHAVVRPCTQWADVESVWEQLNVERPPQEVYGTFPGFRAWVAASAPCEHGTATLPLPLLIERVGRPLALLPAQRQWRRVLGMKLAVLRPIGDEHWSARLPIIGRDPEQSVAALLEALRNHPGWDLLEWGPMPQNGLTLALLREWGRRLGMQPWVSRVLADPVVHLAGSSWQQYYAARSGNLRSQLKRGEAKLARHGPVRLEEYRGGPDLETRLEEFYRVEANGWKGRRATAIASHETTRQFYTRLAHEAAGRGWLRLYALRVGDRCVAADYCLAYRGTVSMLKVGYDEDWSHCSPGQVLRKRVLEHLFAAREDEVYDMGLGGGDHRAYKERWADDERPFVVLRLFNPRSLRARIAGNGCRLRRWLQHRSQDARPQPIPAAKPAPAPPAATAPAAKGDGNLVGSPGSPRG